MEMMEEEADTTSVLCGRDGRSAGGTSVVAEKGGAERSRKREVKDEKEFSFKVM